MHQEVPSSLLRKNDGVSPRFRGAKNPAEPAAIFLGGLGAAEVARRSRSRAWMKERAQILQDSVDMYIYAT
eukprot:575227-Amorphochlora_amoeboformis.AAC.1